MDKGIFVGVPLEQFLHLQWETGTLGLVVGDCCREATFKALQMLLVNKCKPASLGALNSANAWNKPGAAHG